MMALVIVLLTVLMASAIAYLCLAGTSGFALKVKYAVAYIYIRLVKRKIKPLLGFNGKSSNLADTGVIPLEASRRIEAPRALGTHTQATDTVAFFGVHQDGTVVAARLSRHQHRRTEAWLYLRLPDGREFQLPMAPDVNVYNTEPRGFSAAGLAIEVLEPIFRWRVRYNGFLREKSKSSESETEASDDNIVAVHFDFLWRPTYNYVGFPHDYNDKYMAGLLTAKNWQQDFKLPWEKVSEERLEQFGELHGTLTVANESEQRFHLRGLRSRHHENLDWGKIRHNISINAVIRDGTAFHLFFENTTDGPKNFLYGYVVPPCNMSVNHVTKCDIDMDQLKNSLGFPRQLHINLTTDLRNYSIELNTEPSSGFLKAHAGERWECDLVVCPLVVIMDEKKGEGVIEFAAPRRGGASPVQPRVSLPLLEEPKIQNTDQLVVTLRERECRSGAIVGGKAASLALMSSLVHKDENFTVPGGLALTKTSFQVFLDANPAVIKAIREVEKVAWTIKNGSLEEECNRLVDLISASSMPVKVRIELQVQLQELYGPDYEVLKFAVRSSAVGEDGEEMSAAGQNETFLGVLGFENILSSVIKCWASQFAFRSIEYKRQNGQLLNGGMGVVIQRMVDAEVAGVLFSRDPLTGSSTTMIISSNFGLGESVVSATADPDQITLRRSWDDNLTVHQSQVGAKKTMITMSEDGGTVEQEVDTEKASRSTISEKNALRLGRIALFLERCYGNARDIEWAIEGENIYLLQSRPVTTDGNMTDFEIVHEFDTHKRSEMECYSTANVGEVMPGAQSPITFSLVRAQAPIFQIQFSWKHIRHRFDPSVPEGLSNFYGHVFFDLIQQKSWALTPEKGAMGKAMDIGICGRIMDDGHLVQIAIKRYENPPLKARMSLTLVSLRGMLFGGWVLAAAEKKYRNRTPPTVGTVTVQQAVEAISERLGGPDSTEPMLAHMQVTMASMMWNMITLNLLLPGKGDFTLDQYSDFAYLVGSANGAESGDVPFSLQKLVQGIGEEIPLEEFINMTPEDALHWLQNKSKEAGKKFKEFLHRHGHRGLKEFDLGSISWGMDPILVVKIVQGMSKNVASFKDTGKSSTENPINSIKTQLSPMKKRILSLVMRACRKSVLQRERGKSMLIKTYDVMRCAYRHLGDLMVKEGFLPDSGLVVFFTHNELIELVQTRSAKLIRRAKHRRKLHDYMDKLKFAELCEGYPIPLQEQEEVKLDGSTKVIGYPVSQGVVKARARVVESFHQVHTIQPGEILITYSTDIGWSPYFPMLAGVVTEIGGLISHGAVVAREFGLPCIVGAQTATRVFKSGDLVLLDATNGFISKVEE